MKTIRIKAHAPTVYQINSLRAFGLPTTNDGPGGFTGVDYFEDEDEATEYLKNCVNHYYSSHGSEEEINEKLSDCESGYLELDAVTAHIQELQYPGTEFEEWL